MSTIAPERTQPGLRKRSVFENMQQGEIVDHLRSRWTVASRCVDALIESVEQGEITKDDVYPVLHHTIASLVASLYGFTPREAFVDLDLLSMVGDGGRSSSR